MIKNDLRNYLKIEEKIEKSINSGINPLINRINEFEIESKEWRKEISKELKDLNVIVISLKHRNDIFSIIFGAIGAGISGLALWATKKI